MEGFRSASARLVVVVQVFHAPSALASPERGRLNDAPVTAPSDRSRHAPTPRRPDAPPARPPQPRHPGPGPGRAREQARASVFREPSRPRALPTIDEGAVTHQDVEGPEGRDETITLVIYSSFIYLLARVRGGASNPFRRGRKGSRTGKRRGRGSPRRARWGRWVVGAAFYSGSLS